MSNILLEKMRAHIEKKEKATKRKIDLYDVPEFGNIIDTFETVEFKELAKLGLEVAPLQFWVMPAAMRKGVHHESEHGIGEVIYDETNNINIVNSIGGKAFHTIRVLKFAEVFMEADSPLVKDFKGSVTAMKNGNEMSSRERDLIRTACLWHDIFSGGTGDEFDSKRRSMDKNHPHYHRTEFSPLVDAVNTLLIEKSKKDNKKYEPISDQEWELLLYAIEQHMWKWDDKIDIIKFHDMRNFDNIENAYEFMKKYRIVRIVELSDLIASRKQI